MKRLIFAVMALAAGISPALAQGPYEEGRHYFLIEQSTPPRAIDGVQVTEAFSYLCNHCMTFDPYAQSWKERMPEGVSFNRIPVEFGRAAWGLYARAYVAASVMGVEEEGHVPMMDAIWKERKQMRNMEQLAEFYAGFGVDKDKFLATAKSFAVDMQMRREQSIIRESGVTGTPTMLVNGKYRVASSKDVPGFDAMLSVVDYLVQLELTAQASAQAVQATGAEAAAASVPEVQND